MNHQSNRPVSFNALPGRAITAWLTLTLTASLVSAATNVTFAFQDGVDPDGAGSFYSGAYAGTADNRLVNLTEVNQNYGGVNFMGVGMISGYTDRGILKFDLSALTGNNAVSAGTLTLRVATIIAPVGSGTLQVLALTAGESWLEGDDDGNGGAAAGVSTWNNRAHPSTPWTGGVGLGSPGGGSYETTVLDTFAWTSSSSGSFSLAIPQSVIQGWIDNPSFNNGLILRAQTESDGNRFFVSTSEDASIANHPSLSFIAEIPEPTAALLVVLGAVFVIRSRTNA